MLQDLYEEFGKDNVDITRRELTSKNQRLPNPIELYAELCLRKRWDKIQKEEANDENTA